MSSALAQTSEMPAMMILEGKVYATSDGKLSPTNGDVVQVVNSTGKELARTTVSNENYSGLVVTLSLADNGKLLELRYIKGTSTYKAFAGKQGDATFSFVGSVFPARSTLDLIMTATLISSSGTTTPGTTTPGTTTPGTTTPGTTTPGTATPVTGDVDSNGKLDEADVELLRQALSGRIPVVASKMDVNSDGVVNTRDLILLLQTLRTNRQLNAGTVLPSSNTSATTQYGSPAVQAARSLAGGR